MAALGHFQSPITDLGPIPAIASSRSQAASGCKCSAAYQRSGADLRLSDDTAIWCISCPSGLPLILPLWTPPTPCPRCPGPTSRRRPTDAPEGPSGGLYHNILQRSILAFHHAPYVLGDLRTACQGSASSGSFSRTVLPAAAETSCAVYHAGMSAGAHFHMDDGRAIGPCPRAHIGFGQKLAPWKSCSRPPRRWWPTPLSVLG